MTESNSSETPLEKKKGDNLLINILVNIVIPTFILSKASGDEYLGTKLALIVALAFPLLYGLKDFVQTKKVNLFSGLGFVSILLTGSITLLELDPKYIAIKEAAIPGIFGIATLFSLKTRFPLVKTFLYNEKILRVDRIAQALEKAGAEKAFEKVLANASLLVASSFFLSSILNYALAKILLVSAPGSVAFNEELGKMTALSFPVIAVPATLVLMFALFYLFRNIKKLTSLDLDDVLVQQ